MCNEKKTFELDEALSVSLTKVIEQYTHRIVLAPSPEERLYTERVRNREIVKCVLLVLTYESKLKTQDAAVAAAYHDAKQVFTDMSVEAVQKAAGELLAARRCFGDVVISEILILIANLAARMNEHVTSSYEHGKKGGS